MPRNGVRDPQGEAVAGALRGMGFADVRSVRQGKLLEVDVEAASPEAAQARLREMAQCLLANPLIEDFDVETGG